MPGEILEIKVHDGPARSGIYAEKETPALLSLSELSWCSDQPMAYDVPWELAQWSVEETLKKAKKCEAEFAVIHGAKYMDLRIKCAQELENLGHQALIVANGDQLMQRPRDLVQLIMELREKLNPNTALCLPFAEAYSLPLLAYMGVDLFLDSIAKYYAYLNIIMTPGASYPLDQYPLMELDLESLLEYNKKTLHLVIREILANIKNGTLRNLVEQRSCASTSTMSTLRILDKEYRPILEKYTPIH